jgi:hypothetical protein
MARAKTKGELIDSSQKEFENLLDLVNTIPNQQLSEPGVCESWSVKDILAHLHAWHMLFLTWYQEGITGIKPPMPAPGYTWKQTPELNQVLFEEYMNEDYQIVLTSLKESHQEVFSVIEKHSEEELFTKKLFKWTGTTSMGSYLISNTASHYNWASDLIKKWAKSIQK